MNRNKLTDEQERLFREWEDGKDIPEPHVGERLRMQDGDGDWLVLREAGDALHLTTAAICGEYGVDLTPQMALTLASALTEWATKHSEPTNETHVN